MAIIRKLGIDLGTANTLVFVPHKGVILNEPSVVAISTETKKVLAVGEEAKVMIGRTPETIIAHRPLRDGVIADYRVTEAMLRYFIQKALGRMRFLRPDVMISVPAGVTSTERRAVIEAALRAGARNAYVIKEPILAAIGAGLPIYEAHGNMVVDIGGGTTDSAIIALGGIVSANSVKIAGNKIDQAIADYIKEKLNLAIGERTAEEIKISIGSAVPVEHELTCTIKGRDFLTGLPRTTEISTNQVVEAIRGSLEGMLRSIKMTLQDAPPELAADIMSDGIVMTGGGSLLRNIDELVHRSTGVPARVANDALFCVAKGTGTALEHLDTYKASVMMKR
ncbi:MAG: rod shape-determining protein [Patescibacteria group bacterium]